MIALKAASVATAVAVTHAATLYSNVTKANHTCALKPSMWSCSLQAMDLANLDTCCTETFGGLVAQTQFWDTYTGREDHGQLLPKNHWTLHGLWPDFCNGSFTQYCDLDRKYDPNPSPAEFDGKKVPAYNGTSIDNFIKDWERYDLLNYMKTYWVSQGQANEGFWAHEFSKHATCYSTFDVPCYGPKYQKHQDVIEFFDTAVAYFRERPTYDWLKKEHIVPSNKTGYSLKDIEGALTKHYGALPYIGCHGPKYNETDEGKGSDDDGYTVLSEVWYFNHVKGRVQDLDAKHVNSTTPTHCAKSKNAIRYYERSHSSECSAKVPY